MRASTFASILAAASFLAAGCGTSAVGPDDLDGGYAADGGALGDDGGSVGSDGGLVGGDGGGGGDGGTIGSDGGTVGGDGGSVDGGPIVLLSLAVDPAAARVAVGSREQLRATGLYSDGSTADLTSTASWRSDAPNVADVTAGVVRAAAPGTATISATVAGLTGRAVITVPAATLQSLAVTPQTAQTGIGGSVAFHAVATLSDGTTQEVTSPTAVWASSDSTIARIGPDGSATGARAGQVTITATVGAFTATASLTVNPASLTSIALNPTTPTVGRNVTVAFAATGTYSDGSVADVTQSATWASSAPSVASITAGGVATALSAGTSVITASVGSVAGRTTLTVTPASLQRIAITPATVSLAPRGTAALTATGTYSDGTTADLTASVTWASGSPAVASVSNAGGGQGTVTAIAPGMATITAKLGDVSATASVTVLAATLTSLAIAPAAPTVPLGATVSLTAKGTYSDGSVLDVTNAVAWTVDNGAIASISNADGSHGQVRGLAVGATQAHASLSGQTASTTLTVSPATLGSIAITPANPSVAVGLRQPLTATGTFSDGTTVDLTASVVWATADARIASVSNANGAQGQLTALATGTTAVTATQVGVTGTTTVTVTAAALTQLAVTPIAPSRAVGQRIQFAATAIYSNGTQQNVTLQATWTSANTSIATINGQGQAAAVAVGRTTITAAYRGLTASTPFTVTSATPVQLQISPIAPTVAVGNQLFFQATAVMSDNTSQNVTMNATWASSAPGVLLFGGGGGGGGRQQNIATGISAGSATVTVSWSGLTATTPVTVTAAVPVSLTVSPATVSEAVGTRRQFTASAIYSDNTSRDVTAQATWVSSAPSIVGVNDAGGGPGGGGQKGLATALAAGTATITATWSGLSGTATFTVTAATLTSIVVSPAAVSLAVGTTRPLTAQAIYSDNTSLDVTGAATWISSAPAIAAVSDGGGGPGGGGGRGTVTGLAAGSATLTAAWGGMTGTAAVTVTPATIASIQVTPIQPSVAVGTPVLFQATAIFSDNTTQTVSQLATWISSAPAVASVSTGLGIRGIAQTLSAGTATITATYNGVSGRTVLTVTPARLVTIQVTPFAPTLPIGFTTRLAATGIYSDNSTQDLTGLATWTSSAPAVASVSSSPGSRGVVTPLSAGTATISATYDGVTGSDAVRVTDATLRSIAVTPSTASIALYASQPFTAVGTFSDASTLDVTTYVTWLSSTPSIADVSNAAGSQGVAKGLSAGTVTITAVRGSVTGTASLSVAR